MRSITNAKQLEPILPKVEIYYDDGTSETITSGDKRLFELSWGTNIDEDDWHCSMQLRNHEDFVKNNKSLDPLDSLSNLNKDSSDNYDPLLSNNHKVEVSISKDDGSTYDLVFEGLAGHGLDTTKVIERNDTVSFKPYGLSQALKEDQREVVRTYEDRDLATSLLRSILIDSGFTAGRYSHVVVQDDPSKQVPEFVAEKEKTWKLLQNAVQSTGYKLAFRYHASGTAYNDGSGESTPADGFYLTLYDPNRNISDPANRTLDATYGDKLTARKIDYSIDDVRTSVKVCYQSSITGASKCITPVTDEDARQSYGIPILDTSQDKKHRPMTLAESDSSLIDTGAEAVSLANYALHDVSSPAPTSSVEIDQKIWPDVEPHDYVKYEADDYDIKVGTVSVEHDWSNEDRYGSTMVKGNVSKVIGTHTFWMAHELTEEEQRARRQKKIRGAIKQLPDPQLIDVTSYPAQGNDGRTVSALSVRWKRVEAWWYGGSKIWIKDLTDKESWVLRKTVRDGSHTIIKPVEPGHEYEVRIQHIASANISPQGDR